MRLFLVTIAVGVCGLLSAATARSQGWDSYGQGPKDLKSTRYRFTRASLMFSPSENSVAMGLELENRTDAPMWVKVAIRGAGSDTSCEKVVALGVRESATIVCPRETVVPDLEYPVTIEVFEDSLRTTAVEQGSSQLKFRKKDLEELATLKAASVLPQTYEHVEYKKKIGAGTAVFGRMGPPAVGTLTVGVETVEWKSKKQTVSVPAAGIQRVRMQSVGQSDADTWVVVEYEEGGEKKIMALKPSDSRGKPADTFTIHASLQALAAKH